VKALGTARLTLDPVTPRNAAALWRVMQSPGLREFQDVPHFTRDEFAQRVAARPRVFGARTVGRFEWLVTEKKDRMPIGWVSLRVGEAMRGSAELGYSLIPAHRACGYATEAVAAVLHAGFAESTLRRIDACCVPENLPSRRLLERLGFRQNRVQRAGAVVHSRAVDVMVFEMTRERWNGLQSGSANSIVIPASSKPK
jgi:ribosomal-protein-alanine N-acetyltransferase